MRVIFFSLVISVLLVTGVYAQTRTAPTTSGALPISSVTDTASQKKNLCPQFTQLLYWGVTDRDTKGEVSRLQTYLRDRAGYRGKISGVYDEDTELAVRRLQKINGIVKPGLSCQTGYGIVEAKTRKYLNDTQSCEPVIPRKIVSCAGVPQCPAITVSFKRGAADTEGIVGPVATLQCFLKSNGMYTGPINGSFGYLTENALRSWQKSRAITATGSIGPQTQEAIARCAEAVVQSEEKERAENFSLHIIPASGKAPLTIRASFALNGTTCTSYEVDWGDGTAAESYDAGRPATCTPMPVTFSVDHVYSYPGTYTVSVKYGQDALSRLPVANQATVSVE